jgi:hypothetical protein
VWLLNVDTWMFNVRCADNVCACAFASALLCRAVCSVPHPVKGESIYAYVSVLDDAQPSAKLHAELVNLVKNQIGSFAAPDVIHWAPGGFDWCCCCVAECCGDVALKHLCMPHVCMQTVYAEQSNVFVSHWCPLPCMLASVITVTVTWFRICLNTP